MNKLKQLSIKLPFSASLVIVAMIALFVRLYLLIPDAYSSVRSLSFGFAGFYGLLDYLNLLPSQMNRARLRFTVLQMVVVGIFASWLGWDNDTVSKWFGNYVFLIYLVLPLTVEVGVMLWEKINSTNL